MDGFVRDVFLFYIWNAIGPIGRFILSLLGFIFSLILFMYFVRHGYGDGMLEHLGKVVGAIFLLIGFAFS